MTCTQVLQQWSIPSNSGTTKAVKFEELTFEKADYARDKEDKRKRPLVQGKRENYCSTPPYAKKTFQISEWNEKKNVDGSTGNQGMIIKWAELWIKLKTCTLKID